jgi:hypothetical protein
VVRLAWATSSETGNAGFEVQQRSPKGSFFPIGFVESRQTMLSEQTYQFDVNGLAPGRHAFRLEQIDVDGQSSNSPVVEIATSVPGRYYMEPAYPNPFNPTTTFRFAVSADQHVRIELLDVAGRVVRVMFEGIVPADEIQTQRIDAGGLPGGFWLLRLAGEKFTTSQRLVLVP